MENWLASFARHCKKESQNLAAEAAMKW